MALTKQLMTSDTEAIPEYYFSLIRVIKGLLTSVDVTTNSTGAAADCTSFEQQFTGLRLDIMKNDPVNCSIHHYFGYNVCCSFTDHNTIRTSIHELDRYKITNGKLQTAENIVDVVCGVIAIALNLVLITSCKNLIARGKLPWRRYQVVMNTSVIDLFASVFLLGAGAAYLFDRYCPQCIISVRIRRSVMMAVRNSYECFAIILGLDVCVTSFVQIIALKLPLTYRLKLTKSTLKKVLSVEWLFATLHCVVAVLSSLPIPNRVEVAVYHLFVMFTFFVITTLLCIVSLIAVVYFIVKLHVNWVKLFQKIWRAQGVNFWLIGLVYLINSIILAIFLKHAILMERNAHDLSSCGVAAGMVRVWLVYQRDFFLVLALFRFLTILIILQHPLFHIFTNDVIHKYIKTCTLLRIRRPRRTTSYEPTSTKTIRAPSRNGNNVPRQLSLDVSSPLLLQGIVSNNPDREDFV